MHKPLISIITPVWNGLSYLKECIESVLAQDFQQWELLISDDGSTDGSRAYLDTLADSRIKVFKQDHNLGIFGNLNFLFGEAKAPLSQILCQDDHFAGSTSLTAIMKYWKHATAEIGFVRFNHFEPSRCRTINLQTRITPAVITPDMANLWFFVFGNVPGNLSNVSLRTRLVADLGWFNPDLPFAGDFDFWSRAARKVSVGMQKKLVVYVRRHEQAASIYLGLKGELYTQHITIYEKLIEELTPKYSRNKLVAYFNLEICSLHYRTGIKAALNGRFGYLHRLIQTNSAIVWPNWVQFIACLPFVLFNGRQKITVHMAKHIINI